MTTVIIVIAGISFGAISHVMKAETNVRYVGLQNIISEKMAKTIKGMETNYCTFVEPIFDASGQLACVCGADITFDWLTKELLRIDHQYRNNEALNRYQLFRDLDFFSVVIDHDGSCLIHPESKKLSIKDKDILQNMSQRKCGTADMTVDGIDSKVYYGPIEGIDWTLVIVTPKHDIQKPVQAMGIILLVTVLLGIVAVWIIYRRIKNAEQV